MKYHLPILIEGAVRTAEAVRTQIGHGFEIRIRAEGKTATCSPGCHHCCYYPVMISLLEGITLFRYLIEHGLWTRDLQTRCKETHQQVWGLSRAVWMLSMTPCPILTPEGRCGAYGGRPFVCRTTVSTDDPELCHPHKFMEAGLVRMTEGESAGWPAELKLLKNVRLPAMRLPIATALLTSERICKEGLAPAEIGEHLFEEWARLA